ncbi:hypothetical protein B566_EDAN011337 [Ephemera danica]|nr:hypothetical protein B566_EDAN011337 [Ephemera danica]
MTKFQNFMIFGRSIFALRPQHLLKRPTVNIRNLIGENNLSGVYQKNMDFNQKPQPYNPIPVEKFPVPALKPSIERYLESAKPFLTEAEYAVTTTLAREFIAPGGVGERLQGVLEERAKNHDNWLEEWWLNYAYLDYRDSLVINSNTAVTWNAKEIVAKEEQLQRAASIIASALDFKTIIDEGKLAQHKMGDIALDMSQYYNVFATCRIPGEKRDSLRRFLHKEHAKHIIVMHNYHFFVVTVYGEDGKRLHKDQILQQLRTVVAESSEPSTCPVDPENCDVLDMIERSIVVVSLDAELPRHELSETRNVMAAHSMMHGGGLNSPNRWFDKAINVTKIDELEICCFLFKNYGTDFIKSKKLSPDSYIQMVIQLAYYRFYGKPGAQYESASLRRYINGRTEAIRSCSAQAVDFCRVMLDANATFENKAKFLQAAISTHKNITLRAISCQGVDRHLLGLRLAAEQTGIEIPQLFRDPGFTRSSHYCLSTSQVPMRHGAFNLFGPVVPDGYGICYNPRPHEVSFGITALKSCSESSASKMAESLEMSKPLLSCISPTDPENCDVLDMIERSIVVVSLDAELPRHELSETRNVMAAHSMMHGGGLNSPNRWFDKAINVTSISIKFAVTKSLAHEFAKPGGDGERLQAVLEERAKTQDNWLSEWWLNHVYLDSRESLPINSNTAMTFNCKEVTSVEEQLQMAASYIAVCVDFKNILDKGQLPQDKLGPFALDMTQNYQEYNTCRIPGEKRDTLRQFQPGKRFFKFWLQFFKLPVYGEDGSRLNHEQLIQQLRIIIAQSPEPSPHPVGILTAERRDKWYRLRQELLKEAQNREALDAIETSLILISLDAKPSKVGATKSERDLAAAMDMTHGSGCNTPNRWSDKILNGVVGWYCSIGMVGEHSAADGHAFSHCFNYIGANLQIDNCELDCYIFADYGSDAIKSMKLSPDSFIQMAIQLAYYRYWNNTT